MSISETLTHQHWNYFFTLDDDVARLSRYLELTQTNFASYSLELARILFAAASEVDVVSKRLCRKLDGNSKACNITAYRKEICPCYPQITDTRVEVPRFGLILNPWEQWGKNENPLWWKAYNNVKHHRHTHFSEANLKHALNAVAGLFVLLLFFYRNEAENAELHPDPILFRAGSPFRVGRPFYDSPSHSRPLFYRLSD